MDYSKPRHFEDQSTQVLLLHSFIAMSLDLRWHGQENSVILSMISISILNILTTP